MDDVEEESLSFKPVDVAKMHAYRDALPSVRSAFILYPGDKAVTFPALDAGATSADAIGALPLVACTGPCRTPIPEQAEHPFRRKPNTDSGPFEQPDGLTDGGAPPGR